MADLKGWNLSSDTLADIEGLDAAKCGFCREENRDMPVDEKQEFFAHLIVVTSQPATEWHPRTNGPSDPEAILQSLCTAAKLANAKVRVSLAYFRKLPRGAQWKDGDVIAFVHGQPPRLYPYKAEGSIQDRSFSYIVEAVSTGATRGSQEISSPEQFVLICAHTKRDARCGYCGAVLADIAEKAGTSAVGRISHVGGHAYAGNVMIYDKEGYDFFGFVKPEMMAPLMKRQWSPEMAQLLRGRLGAPKAEVEALRSSPPCARAAGCSPRFLAVGGLLTAAVAYCTYRLKK